MKTPSVIARSTRRSNLGFPVKNAGSLLSTYPGWHAFALRVSMSFVRVAWHRFEAMSFIFCIIFFLSGCQTNKTYPYPMWEVYEGKSPNAAPGALRISAIWWPEGVYKYPPPHVCFRQEDGTLFDVEIWDNDPKWWKAYRIAPNGKREPMPLERIYFQMREPTGPWKLYPTHGGEPKTNVKK
jgi:hypothetical protein